MAESLADQVALEQVGPQQYVSKVLPKRMGNALPIAYGGFTMGLATHAAHDTVPTTHSLYSLVGHFLGPASTEAKLQVNVYNIRDTRSFVTRRVEVSQRTPQGTQRLCLHLVADFHLRESGFFAYHANPRIAYSEANLSLSLDQLLDKAISDPEPKISPQKADGIREAFKVSGTFFDTRFCPEGIFGQNIMGSLAGQSTTQDSLPLVDRTSGDWVKSREVLDTPAERMAVTAFLLDGGLAFVPLAHSGRWLGDAAACSTLDFALRLFATDVKLHEWHLRERQTIAAGAGRTYTEGRLWDKSGAMVASITQQSILRWHEPSEAKL